MNRQGNRLSRPSRRFVLLALGLLLLAPQAGCLGLLSNVMHAVGADLVPPEYDGLQKSKLAVVTITEGSQYSEDASAKILSQKVAEVLGREVKKIEIVRHDLIEQWRDTNGYDSVEFVELGRQVDADKILVVELSNLTLRDGQTLYRGRADATISVYDVETEKVVYKRSVDEFTFPATAGQHTSETTETRFRKLYLGMLAQQIGRYFHPYDMTSMIAQDSKIAGL